MELQKKSNLINFDLKYLIHASFNFCHCLTSIALDTGCLQHYLSPFLIILLIYFRFLIAVYGILGKEGDTGRAQELFAKMDQNYDGSISQDEFITIMKQEKLF